MLHFYPLSFYIMVIAGTRILYQHKRVVTCQDRDHVQLHVRVKLRQPLALDTKKYSV